MVLRILIPCIFLLSSTASEAVSKYRSNMKKGRSVLQNGEHYKAARYFFQASLGGRGRQKAMAYAFITSALTARGLYESASYFYLKTLGSGSDDAIEVALRSTKPLIQNIGGSLFKKYLLKYTHLKQYSRTDRDYYLYYLAKDHVLKGRGAAALLVIDKISDDFALYPQLLFLQGTAFALDKQPDEAVDKFVGCARTVFSGRYKKGLKSLYSSKESSDLYNRCLAGAARSHYQNRDYESADVWYSRIDINSIVWPQVLYERAWNYVAQKKYNHALGKLVTYKAPALDWFLNSDVELLRAINYFKLCLYKDVETELNSFTSRYYPLESNVKKLLSRTASESVKDIRHLYNLGVRSLKGGFHSQSSLVKFMSRFAQSPRFARIVQSELNVRRELNFLRKNKSRHGLSGFLGDVLDWRKRSVYSIGGFFIRNRLDTEYKSLVKNIKKADILKLEILNRKKNSVVLSLVNESKDEFGEIKRGSLGAPSVTEHEYLWRFNGEFWSDELGGYVFALQSECS